MTVVMKGTSGRTYLGRYHERTPRGVVLRDAAVFDPATGGGGDGVEVWLERQKQFGVRVEHRALVVPTDEAGSITRFLDD